MQSSCAALLCAAAPDVTSAALHAASCADERYGDHCCCALVQTVAMMSMHFGGTHWSGGYACERHLLVFWACIWGAPAGLLGTGTVILSVMYEWVHTST